MSRLGIKNGADKHSLGRIEGSSAHHTEDLGGAMSPRLNHSGASVQGHLLVVVNAEDLTWPGSVIHQRCLDDRNRFTRQRTLVYHNLPTNRQRSDEVNVFVDDIQNLSRTRSQEICMSDVTSTISPGTRDSEETFSTPEKK